MTQHSNAGWFSNGPVQFNVAGDVNIHGGCTHAAIPDDGVLPRAFSARKAASAGRRVWTAVKLFLSGLWFLAKVMFWVGLALLVLAPLIAAMLLSVCIWLLGRCGEQLLWIEFKLGGGPTQLAYIPTLDHSARRAQLKVVADSEALGMRCQQRTRSNEAASKNPGPTSLAPAAIAQLPRSTVSPIAWEDQVHECSHNREQSPIAHIAAEPPEASRRSACALARSDRHVRPLRAAHGRSS